MFAVQMESVGFEWPDGQALCADLSLSLAQGEILALVGPSGCGKSTLLRLAAGQLMPTSGKVHTGPGPRSCVFQSPTLLPWRSLADNVALPLELSSQPKQSRVQAVSRVLDLVGLSDCKDHLPRQLSGGMQMRASLARALVNQPNLMLLDEAFSALDGITRGRLQLAFLEIWRAQGFSVLMVSHDLDEALWMADRVLVFSGPPLKLEGEVVSTLQRPRVRDQLHSPQLSRLLRATEAML